MAIMVDQGHLSYDSKITEYWPEFGQNGKENLTVSDVLKHESGLMKFNKVIPMEYLTTEAIKQNKMGEFIENEKCYFVTDPAHKRQYHMFSRDMITNEIFRRVEPSKRTMGEYLRQEILPNFDIEVFSGMTDPDYKKHIHHDWVGHWKNFKEIISGANFEKLWHQGPGKVPIDDSMNGFGTLMDNMKKNNAMKKE